MEISEITRRNIIDWLRLNEIIWNGRLNELEFLERIYDLDNMPSNDRRYQTANQDISKHRLMNDDWEDYWVFYDKRFQLLKGQPEIFLQFLCEMIHPIIRPEWEEVSIIVKTFNSYLQADGWKIVEKTRISNAPVYAARPLLISANSTLIAAHNIANILDATYVTQQITRMEVAVESDPELAIGTAKEFVETICRTILEERKITYGKGDSFPQLIRKTIKVLNLAPNDIPERAKAADTIRKLLNNLATIANALSELRNPYGTGHGKGAKNKGLRRRHARLAVGAASTLAVFLFETHEERKPE